MGECKKALEEANGDMDKATEILRKKGMATLAKRAERETTEGAVVAWQSSDGKTAAMATLCCETDFVSKSDDFVALAGNLREYIAKGAPKAGAATVLETVMAGKNFQEILTEVVSKTGITKSKAEVAVEAVFETMKKALARGDRIELRGFGVFNVRPRKTGIGRNPRTGAEVSIPPGKAVRFKPGKELQSID
jgi:DNA-binding protein HU-beta